MILHFEVQELWRLLHASLQGMMPGYVNILWKEQEYVKLIMDKTNRILVIGILRAVNTESKHIHLEDYVYSELGLAPTLTARDYKDPRRILINEDNHVRSN